MADRYHPGHGGYPPPSRSPTFANPGRSSMPSGIGYSSLYADDMYAMPPPPPPPRHPTAVPRGYTTATAANGIPTTTTRTYGVSHDPRIRPVSAVYDHGRSRRSTMDSAQRPPVIVTTTRGNHTHHRVPSQSPVRTTPRASDSHLHAHPTSARSRSTAAPHRSRHHADAEDHVRPRDRERGRERERERERERTEAALAARDAEVYRSSRPSVIYPSSPRHTATIVDYGDDGYQYTNAGEMARHDLGLARPSRNHRRGESLDHGYYRPNVSYNTSQRSIDVNTSGDLSRNYPMNTSRLYEGHSRGGGPPPSTRGFDSIDRSRESSSRAVPPAAPAPPQLPKARRADPASGPSEHRESRRPRPVSLYQDATPRSSRHEEYHRNREEERSARETRDRDRGRDREPDPAPDGGRFQDDSVSARGFGIRPPDDYDDRREQRYPDPRRSEARKRTEDSRERREDRRERDEEPSRSGDKVAAGVGVAAAAMGLVPALSGESGRERNDKEPRRRRSPEREREPRIDAGASDRPRPDEMDHPEADLPKDREREQQDRHELVDSPKPVDDGERNDLKRISAEAAGSGPGSGAGSDSERAAKGVPRRHGASNTFNPNDATDITMLREQLAAMNTSKDDGEERQESMVLSRRRSRSDSPPRDRDDHFRYDSDEESRGREMALVSADGAVRVVSPPRDKREDRPLRGILKQPRPRFPEAENYMREGVAPHKEDKKVKDVPPGARWTKISRQVVNPEALTIGKERFEVRDDSVIVLRVLSKEEIQAYATATQQLRERRRGRDYDGDEDDRAYEKRSRNQARVDDEGDDDDDQDHGRRGRNQARVDDEHDDDYDERHGSKD